MMIGPLPERGVSHLLRRGGWEGGEGEGTREGGGGGGV